MSDQHVYWRFDDAAPGAAHGAVATGSSARTGAGAGAGIAATTGSVQVSVNSTTTATRYTYELPYCGGGGGDGGRGGGGDASDGGDGDGADPAAPPPPQPSRFIAALDWCSAHRRVFVALFVALTVALAATLVDIYLFRAAFARSDFVRAEPPVDTLLSVEFGFYHWCVSQHNIDYDPSLVSNEPALHADVGCYTYMETCGADTNAHASELYLFFTNTLNPTMACPQILAYRGYPIVMHAIPFVGILLYTAVALRFPHPPKYVVSRYAVSLALFIPYCILRRFAVDPVLDAPIDVWPPYLYRRWGYQFPPSHKPFLVSWGCLSFLETPNIAPIVFGCLAVLGIFLPAWKLARRRCHCSCCCCSSRRRLEDGDEDVEEQELVEQGERN